MIKKYFICIIIWTLLVTVSASSIAAQTQDSANATKIKAAVRERGTGEEKRVAVKLFNGAKQKGYISQADENSFTLIDRKTRQPSTIAYSDVAKINNIQSSGDKIALWILAGVATVGAITLISIYVGIRRS